MDGGISITDKRIKIGFDLPLVGPAANVDSIVKIAKRAEELKYDGLWVNDRLLYPTDPQTRYFDRPIPDSYKRAFDPLETLTFAAAHTNRVTLGTSVLDIPFYNPVVLARRLTTLDVLSAGRLRVGFGLGWSKDEYDATGAEMKSRGRRADEFIGVLHAIWTTDPAEFHGKFFQLPKSIIQPKPVQKPHPPIYLAAFSPGAMKRTAKLADGWIPSDMTVEQLKAGSSQLRSMMKDLGRDPAKVKIITRYNFTVTPQPQGKERAFFSGTLAQIKEDAAAIRAFGPDEVIFSPALSPDTHTGQDFLRNLEEIRKILLDF